MPPSASRKSVFVLALPPTSYVLQGKLLNLWVLVSSSVKGGNDRTDFLELLSRWKEILYVECTEPSN